MSESHSVSLDLKTKHRGTLGIAEHGRVYEGSQVAILGGKDGTELHGTGCLNHYSGIVAFQFVQCCHLPLLPMYTALPLKIHRSSWLVTSSSFRRIWTYSRC